MDKVDTVDKVRIETCDHRGGTQIQYLRNDNVLPPVLWIGSAGVNSVVILTNQTIFVKCYRCYSAGDLLEWSVGKH